MHCLEKGRISKEIYKIIYKNNDRKIQFYFSPISMKPILVVHWLRCERHCDPGVRAGVWLGHHGEISGRSSNHHKENNHKLQP